MAFLIPLEFRKMVVAPLYTLGQSLCNNWRFLSIVSPNSKVRKVLLEGVSKHQRRIKGLRRLYTEQTVKHLLQNLWFVILAFIIKIDLIWHERLFESMLHLNHSPRQHMKDMKKTQSPGRQCDAARRRPRRQIAVYTVCLSDVGNDTYRLVYCR